MKSDRTEVFTHKNSISCTTRGDGVGERGTGVLRISPGGADAGRGGRGRGRGLEGDDLEDPSS